VRDWKIELCARFQPVIAIQDYVVLVQHHGN
jgi:hypothetical protein